MSLIAAYEDGKFVTSTSATSLNESKETKNNEMDSDAFLTLLVAEMKNQDPRVFVPQQFENPANPMIHRHQTGLEILEQVGGPIDGFCSGIGTGGTITGIGETLKALNPDMTIWAVEPENAAILAGGTVGSHLQMGIGDGLIPAILNQEIYSDIYIVSDEEALQTARDLARLEGLMCGISSGTNVADATGTISCDVSDAWNAGAASVTPESHVVQANRRATYTSNGTKYLYPGTGFDVMEMATISVDVDAEVSKSDISISALATSSSPYSCDVTRSMSAAYKYAKLTVTVLGVSKTVAIKPGQMIIMTETIKAYRVRSFSFTPINVRAPS